MLKEILDFDELRQDPNFRVLNKEGWIYKGLVNEKGQRHGRGVLICKDKSVYAGEFVKD
jgi:hypothetical protein